MSPRTSRRSSSAPSETNILGTPIFIILRDRLEGVKQLLEWLDAVRLNNILLVDNASTYPPLVSFLKSTSHQVIRT